MYTCTVCYDDIIIQEVCTEELQATGDVTLDKETIEQLQQAHKQLKIELLTTNRTLEGKKAMSEKQEEWNKGTVAKTSALQIKKCMQVYTYCILLIICGEKHLCVSWITSQMQKFFGDFLHMNIMKTCKSW